MTSPSGAWPTGSRRASLDIAVVACGFAAFPAWCIPASVRPAWPRPEVTNPPLRDVARRPGPGDRHQLQPPVPDGAGGHVTCPAACTDDLDKP